MFRTPCTSMIACSSESTALVWMTSGEAPGQATSTVMIGGVVSGKRLTPRWEKPMHPKMMQAAKIIHAKTGRRIERSARVMGVCAGERPPPFYASGSWRLSFPSNEAMRL